MEFEWDEDKRFANLSKHGIDFADALAMWENAVIDPAAERIVSGELRLLALGTIGQGETIVAVVYTERGAARRLISARRARKDERQDYQETFGRGS